MAENFWTKLKSLTGNYFALGPYLVTQQEAEASIREGVSFRGTNLIILVLAIFIASLGLNTNSTAVIIGAMLISPLMGPIIGIGLGIGITDFGLLKRSLRNLVVAAIFSMLASSLYFLISPVAEGHSELLARTSPTIYDVLIGFFGGGAGIVAICSKSKGNVIPGVAIATALMPPLCTAGYGLATLQMHYFLGASYLFIINSIFICLATFIGVKLFQFKPLATAAPDRVKRIRRITYTIALLTLLPSIYLTYNLMRMNRFELNADRFINHECQWPDTHVLSSSESWGKDGRQINLTLIGKAMPQDSLLIALSSRLRFYNLEGTRLKIFQGDAPMSVDELKSAAVSDIYHISQTAMQSKQMEIDSLNNILGGYRASFGMAADILPELRVVFPKVDEIAITKAIVAKPADGLTDTVNIALVNTTAGFTDKQKTELRRYLEARLKLQEVKVVEVPRIIR